MADKDIFITQEQADGTLKKVQLPAQKIQMNTKPDGYATMTSVKTTPVAFSVKQSGATGVCYSVNGGTPVYVAGSVGANISLSSITDPNGALVDIAVWPATSATSGRVGDLTTLQCQASNLTTLDVSGLTALVELTCQDNNLTSLDVSGLTALVEMQCQGNSLTTLDVSGSTALVELYCQGNNLTTLDVSGLTALTYLYCQDNNLTTLDVSGLTALAGLSISHDILITLIMSGNSSMILVQANGYDGPVKFVGDLPFSNYGGYVGYATIDLSSIANLTTDALYEALIDITIPDPGLDAGILYLTGSPCLGGGSSIVDGVTYTAAQVEALLSAKKLYY